MALHQVASEPLVERFRSAGASNVTVKVYPGARHEVLHETNRSEVIADVVAWVQRVLGDASR